jgi:hypothetical protein
MLRSEEKSRFDSNTPCYGYACSRAMLWLAGAAGRHAMAGPAVTWLVGHVVVGSVSRPRSV